MQPPPPRAGRARARRHPRGWRHPHRVPRPPDSGNRQAPHRRARPQPRLPESRRDALWLPARRRRPDHRLRQDHPRRADGCRHRQHPRHRAVGRPDAQRLARGRAHRQRHHRLESPRDAQPRRDRRCRLYQAGRLVGALHRLLQYHGHGHHDELAGRGAGHEPARQRRHPRPLSRPPGMRLAHRQAHRRHGPRGSQTFGHPDARGLPQRHRRQQRDRRQHQRADPPRRDRPPHGRGPRHPRLADPRPQGAVAGQPATRRRVPRRGLLPRRRRPRRGGAVDRRRPDPRNRAHRQRPVHRRQLPHRAYRG